MNDRATIEARRAAMQRRDEFWREVGSWAAVVAMVLALGFGLYQGWLDVQFKRAVIKAADGKP